MKEISSKTIIICSIVRDAETGLKNNIPVIDKLCSLFKDYRIYVYENDSKDKTKEILKEWHSQSPEKIHISINDVDATKTIPTDQKMTVNPFFSRKRIGKMVNIRNNYIRYIKEQNWEADYIMVVDMDVAQLFLDGILSSFKSDIQWDAVTAFGYSTSPKLRRRYHDTYALTMWGDENNPQTEEKIKINADKLGKLKPTDNWIRVFSAFGGLAIYKFEAVKGIEYKLIPNEDDRIEVKCEHFSITKQMAEKGYNKFYINPSMELKYQRLTLSIILKRIKNILLIR